MFDEYIEYAVLLIVISLFSIVWGLYFIRKNEKALKDKIHSGEKVTVFRKLDNDSGNLLNSYAFLSLKCGLNFLLLIASNAETYI